MSQSIPSMDDHNQFAALKQRVVKLANANHDEMHGLTPNEAMRFVREIMARDGIIFAVWQDLSEPNGVGMMAVKGIAYLRESITSGLPITVKISAVPCVCYEQAVALRQTLGDRPDS